MSAIEDRPDDASADLDELPKFRFDFAVDDTVDPTEVTIFPSSGEDITTQWISIDAEHAVPLESIA